MGEPGQASHVKNWSFRSDRLESTGCPGHWSAAWSQRPGLPGKGQGGLVLLEALCSACHGLCLASRSSVPLSVQLETICHRMASHRTRGAAV